MPATRFTRVRAGIVPDSCASATDTVILDLFSVGNVAIARGYYQQRRGFSQKFKEM